MNIIEVIKKIEPICDSHTQVINKKLNNLTKPLGSLGNLEDFVVRLGNIQHTDTPKINKKRAYVFAADHGISNEGVSAYPSEVTAQMVLNFINGGAAINVLSNFFGADLKVIDVGVNFDFGNNEKIINRKIAKGTKNFLNSPAMTEEEAIQSLNVGLEMAKKAKDDGIDIIIAGEMGIGNTTSASAIASLISGKAVEDVTGRGTGIDDEKLHRKISILKKALIRININSKAPLDILKNVGGFEIGAITGLALGCAYYKIALISDGFIATTAIALANMFNNNVKGVIFPSHKSMEIGHKTMLDSLGLSPVLDFQMRLGEGTGAMFVIPVMESALSLYYNMATFESAHINNKE